ncbi:MAG: helix-turn-helix domain-containing protein [Victivallales bacterium]
MKETKEILQKLDEYLTKNRIQKKEFAEKLGVSKGQLSKWFSSGKPLGKRNINAISFLINVKQKEQYDKLTEYIIEEVQDLSPEQKGKLVTFIERLKKEDETPDNHPLRDSILAGFQS